MRHIQSIPTEFAALLVEIHEATGATYRAASGSEDEKVYTWWKHRTAIVCATLLHIPERFLGGVSNDFHLDWSLELGTNTFAPQNGGGGSLDLLARITEYCRKQLREDLPHISPLQHRYELSRQLILLVSEINLPRFISLRILDLHLEASRPKQRSLVWHVRWGPPGVSFQRRLKRLPSDKIPIGDLQLQALAHESQAAQVEPMDLPVSLVV